MEAGSLRGVVYKFCDYQERCHMEVRRRLFELGLREAESEEMIAELIADDRLNEERYSMAIASGKFRIKYWGKRKIRHYLKQHQVSDYCIEKALGSIDPDEYYRVLQRLAQRKLQELHKESPAVRKNKTVRYLLQKGYETDLITVIMAEFGL